eukprot:590165-Prymnesium_polylepis.1
MRGALGGARAALRQWTGGGRWAALGAVRGRRLGRCGGRRLGRCVDSGRAVGGAWGGAAARARRTRCRASTRPARRRGGAAAC